MLIVVLYHLILILGEYIFFGESKLGDEVLGVYGVEVNFEGCRSDGDFILDDIHDYQVELIMRHVEFFCCKFRGEQRKDLGLN